MALTNAQIQPFDLRTVVEPEITELYVSYWGRAADPAGFEFWVNSAVKAIDNGQTLEKAILDITGFFAASSEAKARYGFLNNPNTSNRVAVEEFVNQIYLNCFGRAAETAGLKFWSDVLQANPSFVPEFIQLVLNGAQGSDKTTIENRKTVASDFTNKFNLLHNEAPFTNTPSPQDGVFGPAAGQTSQSIISAVTAESSSVITAKAATDAFMAAYLVPVYSLQSTPATSVNEGQSIAFTLTTTYVAPGSVLTYQIASTGGITTADIVGGQLTGTIIVGSNGTAAVSINIAVDALIEGNEQLTLNIINPTLPLNQQQVATRTVTVNDVLPTFGLTASSAQVSEGGSVTFTLTTSAPVQPNTTFNYTITGVQAADINAPLAGTVTTDAQGKAVFSINVAQDALLETETLTFSIAGQSQNVTIVNVEPGYSLTSSVNTVLEGGTVIFNFETSSPVQAGATFSYTITGVQAEDIVGGQLTGVLTTDASGKATLQLDIARDAVIDTENLLLTVQAPGTTAGNVSKSVAITNVEPGYSLTSSVNTVLEGGTVIFNFETSSPVQAGATFSYTITGIQAADIVGGQLTGVLTTDASGKATLQLDIARDAVIDTENLLLTVQAPGTTAGNVSKSVAITNVEPVYSLTRSAPNVAEGGTVIFNFETSSPVQAGATFSYTITGIQQADIAQPLTGVLTTDSSGKATLQINVLQDVLGESNPSEILTLTVQTPGTSAGFLASSVTIDNVLPLYGLTATVNGATVTQVAEGTTLTFVFTTSQPVQVGATFDYSITGISQADLLAGSLTGTLTTDASGRGFLTLTVAADAFNNENETLNLTVNAPGRLGSPSDTISTQVVITETPQPGLFNLTFNRDTVVGTDFNDLILGTSSYTSFTANGSTLGQGDSLNGGAGVDTLNLSAQGGFDISNFSTVNIEEFVLQATRLSGGSLSLNPFGNNGLIDFDEVSNALQVIRVFQSNLDYIRFDDIQSTTFVVGVQAQAGFDFPGVLLLDLIDVDGAYEFNFDVNALLDSDGEDSINIDLREISADNTNPFSLDFTQGPTLGTSRADADLEAISLSSLGGSPLGQNVVSFLSVGSALESLIIDGNTTLIINQDLGLPPSSNSLITLIDAQLLNAGLKFDYTSSVPGSAVAGGPSTISNGIDTIVTAPVDVFGAQGNNTIGLYSNDTSRPSSIPATNFDVVLFGGNDSLVTDRGSDSILAGAGNDTILAGFNGNLNSLSKPASARFPTDSITNDRDVVDAGEGNNIVTTGDGADSVIAGAGNDRISTDGQNYTNRIINSTTRQVESVVFTDNDTVGAGAGNNTVFTGKGSDSVLAGDGNDSIFVYGDPEFVILPGLSQTFSNPTQTVTVEATIVPFFDNDIVNAGGGNNTVIAGQGDDSVIAGAGNDRIDVAARNGLPGSAFIAANYTNPVDDDSINLTGNAQFIPPTPDTVVVPGIQTVVFTDNDIVNAGDGNNTVFTGTGNDSVIAGSGNDYINVSTGLTEFAPPIGQSPVPSGNNTVSAGNGNNTVIAGWGNDSIITGTGNDTIVASNGNNTVRSGAGNDVIVIGNGNDVVIAGAGNDTVALRGDNLTAADIIDGDNQNDSTVASGTADYISFTEGDRIERSETLQVRNIERFELLNLGGVVTNRLGLLGSAVPPVGFTAKAVNTVQQLQFIKGILETNNSVRLTIVDQIGLAGLNALIARIATLINDTGTVNEGTDITDFVNAKFGSALFQFTQTDLSFINGFIAETNAILAQIRAISPSIVPAFNTAPGNEQNALANLDQLNVELGNNQLNSIFIDEVTTAILQSPVTDYFIIFDQALVSSSDDVRTSATDFGPWNVLIAPDSLPVKFFTVDGDLAMSDVTLDLSFLPQRDTENNFLLGFEFFGMNELLQGTDIERIIVKDNLLNPLLRLDYSNGFTGTDNENDVLRLVNGVDATADDLRNIYDLDVIELSADSTNFIPGQQQVFNITIDLDFITRNNGIVIVADSTLPPQSILNLTVLNNGTTPGAVGSKIEVRYTQNLQVNVLGVPAEINAVTLRDAFVFTETNDNILGTAGPDIFTAFEAGDTNPGDRLNGAGGVDTLDLQFGTFNTQIVNPVVGLSLSQQLNLADIENVEVILFNVPNSVVPRNVVNIASDKGVNFNGFNVGANQAEEIDLLNLHLVITSEQRDIINVDDASGNATNSTNGISGLYPAGYFGTAQPNLVLETGGGNDTITSSAGNVVAGASTIPTFGNNWVEAGLGNDSILMGEDTTLVTPGGNDTLLGQEGADFIGGGAGNDSILGGTDTMPGVIDTINGGTGNDTVVVGNDAPDSVWGGAGNDSIFGGSQNDTLVGNEGNDTILGNGGNDTILGSEGNDSILGGLGNDTVLGGADNDTILGNEGTDSLLGEAGNDSILGGADSDTVLGGIGNDIILGEAGADSLLGNESEDSILGGEANDTVLGGTGNDTILGEAGTDSLLGEGGNDSILGGEANDTILGGTDNDTILGEAGTDSLLGEDGNDSIDGGLNNDTILGGTGNDTIQGGLNDDSILGGEGDDSILGDPAQIIIPASGTSGPAAPNPFAFNVSGLTGTITDINITLAQLTHTFPADLEISIQGPGGQTSLLMDDQGGNTGIVNFVITFDDLAATPVPGTIVDNASYQPVNIATPLSIFNNTNPNGVWQLFINDDAAVDVGSLDNISLEITTTTGVFKVYPIGNNDTIDAGAGNDFVNGGSGRDSILGGTGDDTIDGGSDSDTLLGGFGNDSVFGGLGSDDSILGQEGDDTLNGGSGNDTIFGGANNDTIFGDTGNDSILGETGNDTIDGGTGNDTIDGGEGNDSLILSLGNDIIDGGNNTDTLFIPANTITAGLTLDLNNLPTPQSTGDAGGLNPPSGNSVVLFNIENVDASQAGVAIGINGSNVANSIVGGVGNDTLRGNAGDDTLIGNNGDDFLFGGTGNDSLLGGNGNDTIQGNEGEDSISGGTGADFILGNDGADTIDGGDAEDTIDGGTGNDSILGGAGADFIFGGVEFGGSFGFDTILGGDGNDTIDGGAEADSIWGEAGDDSLVGGTGNDTLRGGEGNDALIGGIGADSLDGGEGNDSIFGDQLDSIDGGVGTDTLFLSADFVAAPGQVTGIEFVVLTQPGLVVDLTNVTGPLTIIGSNGDDTIVGTNQNDTILGGAGNDSLLGGAGNDFIDGGSGNDTISGGAGLDTLLANDGNDSIDGGVDADSINGGAGIDTLRGDAGNDTIVGEQADAILDGGTEVDTLLIGANFNDVSDAQVVGIEEVILTTGDLTLDLTAQLEAFTIRGSEGEDTILAGSGADTIFGNGGNDSIDGGIGNDTLDGGAGDDTLLGGTGSNDSLFGGTGNDSLDGMSGNDTLDGGADNDTLLGGVGDDSIRGDAGADRLDGGAGNDRLDGEAGDDTLVGDQTDVLIDGGANIDTLLIVDNFSNASDGQIVNIENVVLTVAANLNLGAQTEGFNITGSAGNDTILSGAGDDNISGGAGNDSLLGDAGADILNGDTGNDFLDGGAGANALGGGVGNDTLVAGQDDTLLDGGADVDTLLALASFNDASDAQIVNIEAVTLGVAGLTVILDAQTEAFTINGSDGGDAITGGTGNDTIFGNNGDDDLFGNNGNDSILGGAGNDFLFGEFDDDFLDGGVGADNLNGGGNNDTLVGDQTDTLIDGGAETDTLLIVGNFDNISNEQIVSIENVVLTVAANLSLNLQTEIFNITGSSGNDSILSGTGNDIINPGDGNDTVRANDGNDIINGGIGNDSLFGEVGNDSILGGAGNDALNGGDGNDTIFGGEDNDVIDGAQAADTLIGGTGNDTISGGSADNGADSILGDAGRDSLLGGDGNDTIQGGDDEDTIDGQASRDFILGEQGDDSILGGGDNDTISGGQGDDTIRGETGDDSLVGNAGDDVIFGGAGADFINPDGSFGNDLVFGEEDNDTILLSAGTDTLDGGTGIDTLRVPAGLLVPGSTLVVDFSSGQVTGNGVEAPVTSFFTDFEIVDASQAGVNVSIIGGNAGDTLVGSNLADTIQGGTGDDSILGGDGNDIITSLSLGASSDDTVSGGNGNDSIVGTAGDDSLNGDANNDTILGNGGNDTINGGTGNDSINGGTDLDTINGGTGADSLTGGSGVNTFVLNTGDSVASTISSGLGDGLINNGDVLTFGNGVDIITDLVAGNTLDLNSGAAPVNGIGSSTTLAAGTNLGISGSFSSGTGAFTVNNAGADLLFVMGTGGTIQSSTSVAILLGQGSNPTLTGITFV